MDSVPPETRSRMMAANRGRDTGPELLLRRALFARGFRYRVNAPGLPGRPDLKLTRHGAVILVHGCFWHGHDCPSFRMPASNTLFWKAKFKRNRERDARNIAELREAGWRVCVVWECALRGRSFAEDPERLLRPLVAWLEGKRPFLELYGERPGAAGTEGGPVEEVTRRRGWQGRNDSAAVFAAERRAAYRGLPEART